MLQNSLLQAASLRGCWLRALRAHAQLLAFNAASLQKHVARLSHQQIRLCCHAAHSLQPQWSLFSSIASCASIPDGAAATRVGSQAIGRVPRFIYRPYVLGWLSSRLDGYSVVSRLWHCAVRLRPLAAVWFEHVAGLFGFFPGFEHSHMLLGNIAWPSHHVRSHCPHFLRVRSVMHLHPCSHIHATYKSLQATYGDNRMRCISDLFFSSVPLTQLLSTKFWSKIWAAYSLYDPSYSSREA